MSDKSAQSSPSPLQVAVNGQVDESRMPKGHCRYILLLPEIKGQRCACVGFSLNRGIPSATCDCGHLACYHNKEVEPSNEQKHELELLRKRIQQLEEHISKGHEDVLDSVVTRLNEVEDHLEKSREEFGDQIKGAYRNVSISWRSIEQGERKNYEQDEQLRQIYDKLGAHDERLDMLHAGQLELRDADTSLEERIENLTETFLEDEDIALSRPNQWRLRRRSTSDTTVRPNLPLGPFGPLGAGGAPFDNYLRPQQSPETRTRGRGRGGGSRRGDIPFQQVPKPLPASARSTGAWTVHISLLPHASVAMPFERNTNAYQRCLSRGLHRMVPVHGYDAVSFTTAVEKAFGSFLKGRKWMPLQAKLCDAETLQGLPMLRQLEPHMVEAPYDHKFLVDHCAVCDGGGVIDSLYIAMREHTISWHTLRHSPVFVEGLEDAWAYDSLLDTDPFTNNMAIDDMDRPAAGDITTILPPLQQSLKRPLTEMSRSSSFGAASSPTGDNEESRVKRTRPPVVVAPNPLVEIRRRVETA
ncbi:hypothetical protein B0T24DRAFT_273382 [Lasiosphaeria ovina]|uniref:Uncharacterized protein n=1 Tax=Lasiosphaeria ovina TaxID=92902 RepID=A0AAE0KBY2_9PEZI|nr:hypothetical protein B0T24DRAFT_273382 [Lasiosphaeria ovina]